MWGNYSLECIVNTGTHVVTPLIPKGYHITASNATLNSLAGGDHIVNFFKQILF